MNKNKSNTSIRLTPTAFSLLKELAKKLGVSQTAIIEMAIRKMAKENENVEQVGDSREERRSCITCNTHPA